MSIKNILCAYSGEAAHGSGLQHALKLAEHHDAWLTGVLRRGRPMLERRFAAQVPDALIDQLREADEAQMNEVSARFSDMARQAGREDRTEFRRFLAGIRRFQSPNSPATLTSWSPARIQTTSGTSTCRPIPI